MKVYTAASVVLIFLLMIFSCKISHREITPELFLEIENKILSTDLTPTSREDILVGYGLTLKDYSDYEARIEAEPELKAKVGDLRLKEQQK